MSVIATRSDSPGNKSKELIIDTSLGTRASGVRCLATVERFNRETAAKPSRINRLKLTPATVPTAWIRRSQGHADTATSDEGSRLLANFVKSPGGRDVCEKIERD